METLNLNPLQSEQVFALLVQSVENLSWHVEHIDGCSMVIGTGANLFNSTEVINADLENGILTLTTDADENPALTQQYIHGFIDMLMKVKAQKTPQELRELYDVLVGRMERGEASWLQEKPSKANEDTDAPQGSQPSKPKLRISDFFIPSPGFVATPLLINLNCLVFVLMCFSGADLFAPTTQDLLGWGANYRDLTFGGEPWRLITNAFVHIGILHLVFNMYALFYIGRLLEPFLGTKRFLTAYLVSGIAASLNSLVFHDNSVSAGASGAIFGMYGVFVAMLKSDLIDKKARKRLRASILFFVGYNLLYGMGDNIDNSAHIGGLVSGLLFGALYTSNLKRKAEEAKAPIQ